MSDVTITLMVNGQAHTVTTAVHKTLLYLLRDDLHLYGTKDGCREGECGACTVLLDGQPVNACLVLAAQANGRHPQPSDEQIRHALTGNLCRCTGYSQIIEAVKLAAAEAVAEVEHV